METLRLKAHVGKDGKVEIQLPLSFRNRDLEIVVVMTPANSSEVVDENG